MYSQSIDCWLSTTKNNDRTLMTKCAFFFYRNKVVLSAYSDTEHLSVVLVQKENNKRAVNFMLTMLFIR